MLNLSFSTLMCEHWSVDEIIDNCIKNNITGVELREFPEGWLNGEMSDTEALEISKKFKSNGITVTDIASGITIIGSDLNTVKEESIKIHAREIIRIANLLKAKGIRIFLDNNKKSECDEKESEKKLINCVRNICDLAALYHTDKKSTNKANIWIETHGEYSTGKSLKNIIDRIERKNVAVIWDILHTLEFGEKIEQTIDYLQGHIAHVHIKDAKPFDTTKQSIQKNSQWKHVPLGEGIVPNLEVAELLINNEYTGFFSLEWENKWRKELQLLNIPAEAVLKQYAEYMKK